MIRVLFILKEQLGYGGGPVPSKGLFNSAQFIVNALVAAGIEAALVEVFDNNDIDRVLTEFRPTHCIIEALWVVPEKFDVLTPLHPHVKFIVRIHSKTPFIASEGEAIDWLKRYPVQVAVNSNEMIRELRPLQIDPAYLPNMFAPGCDPIERRRTLMLTTIDRDSYLFVGSLGAVRPLKNQLMQALAAIDYAELTGRRLCFFVNDRIECGGEQVIANLRALFSGTPHTLVEYPWCQSHADVLDLVSSFDISMQVSFSETFNIASADAVWAGVPIVVSREVEWAPPANMARPNSIESIIHTLAEVEAASQSGARRSLHALAEHNARALQAWKNFLERNNNEETECT